MVVNAHVAEDDEQALREVHAGERRETVTYFEDTLGRPPGRADDPLREGVKMGTTLVGSPDTVAKGISRLLELSAGGFGGVLFRAHEWASREQHDALLRAVRALRDAALPGLARHHRGLERMGAGRTASGIFGPNVEAVKKAFTDAGRAVPDEFRARTPGRGTWRATRRLKRLLVTRLPVVEDLDRSLAQRRLELCRRSLEEGIGAVVHGQYRS